MLITLNHCKLINDDNTVMCVQHVGKILVFRFQAFSKKTAKTLLFILFAAH